MKTDKQAKIKFSIHAELILEHEELTSEGEPLFFNYFPIQNTESQSIFQKEHFSDEKINQVQEEANILYQQLSQIAKSLGYRVIE